MRHHRLVLACSMACALAVSGTAIAEDCEHEKQLNLTLDAANVSELIVDVGSGSLTVRGNDRLSEIRATGRACASSASLLEELRLEGDSGKRTRVTAHYPDSSWSWGNRYARIDLELEVPSSMALDIDDGSGSIEISQVASVQLDDGSGSIDIQDIEGDVTIDDGSGGIRVLGVRGTVRIEDGSGEIDIESVSKVSIEEDGSGSIGITDVVEDVEIDEDGSGEIRIREVGGNVTIRRDSSGSINVKSVAGDFHVGSDGSGSIQFANVEGEVTIPRDKRNRLK